ncbi:hypothetical protein [Streptomyces caeruleatus]|uniref:hypothetical protein n=1 Tax=Streptomyces caeruleatus TaxID=661399 RepID=UPI00099EDCCD|nr:hypothetical protein [Streptomyces caeruleatus]
MAVWVVLVAVAGGLTLWLRDAAEPRGPYVWERAGPTTAVPSPPEGWESACTTPTPNEDGPVDRLCVFSSR